CKGARAAASAAGQVAAFLKIRRKIKPLLRPTGAVPAADFGLPLTEASFIRRWTWPVAPGFKCPGADAGKGPDGECCGCRIPMGRRRQRQDRRLAVGTGRYRCSFSGWA